VEEDRVLVRIRRGCAVDAAQRERPRSGVDRARDRDHVPDLEAVLLRERLSRDAGGPLAHEGLLLGGSEQDLGIEIEDRGHVDRELSELVLRVLIVAAEPVPVAHLRDARHLGQPRLVREREREHERRGMANDETCVIRRAEARVERGHHGPERAEEKQRDCDGRDREERPPLGMPEMREDVAEILHGRSTPLSR
jgi:hypothetical protein